MSIFLIRHGETALNVSRVVQPADTPLSARGIEQAEALATRLSQLGVTAILSSDLPRALRTAQAISQQTDLPIQTTELLRERNFGDLRGQSYDAMAFDPLTLLEAPPGGESAVEFEQRVAKAFTELVRLRETTGGTLAVVTHGLVLRALLAGHVQRPAGAPVPPHMGNTCINIIDAQAPYAVSLMNCTLHLDPASADNAQALSGG